MTIIEFVDPTGRKPVHVVAEQVCYLKAGDRSNVTIIGFAGDAIEVVGEVANVRDTLENGPLPPPEAFSMG